MQRTTLFNIQFFISIFCFIGITAYNIYLVPFGGMGNDWGFVVLFVTIPVNILLAVLSLIYGKIRNRTYNEGGLVLRIFWVFSLLWLILLAAYALISAVDYLEHSYWHARSEKAAEQRLVYCTSVLEQQGIIDMYSFEGEVVMKECYRYYDLIEDSVPKIVDIDKAIVSIGDELVVIGENLVPESPVPESPLFPQAPHAKTLTISNSSGTTAYIHNSVDGIYTYKRSKDGQSWTESAESYHGKKITFELLDSYCLNRIIEGVGPRCTGYLKITPGNYTLQIKYWGGLESNKVGIVIK